jgi:RNA polymerase sigma factor (sigma-70 family)
VRYNLRLAWAFATRGEVGGGARTEDLFGEAVTALYRAAKRFDAALGTFAQFCEFHLREAWRKHARFEGYFPAGSRALRAQADQVAWRWLERTGREPCMSEIAAALHWSSRETRSARGRSRPLSLDLPMETDGARLMDTLPDEAAESPAATALRAELRALVRHSLAALEPRTRAIIERRFGFGSVGAADLPAKNRPRPLRAVGAELGLSGERVRQLEGEGLAQLRRMLADGIDAGSDSGSAPIGLT